MSTDTPCTCGEADDCVDDGSGPYGVCRPFQAGAECVIKVCLRNEVKQDQEQED